MSNRLIIATRNAHKVEEIRAMLPDWEVFDLSIVPDAPEVEETGGTFLENATLKALAIAARTDALVLADDSGLEVDALDGAPGVYSARFAGEGATDEDNNRKLLKLLDGLEDRAARFRCVLVLARGTGVLTHCAGSVEGHIALTPFGNGGFGYDPLFVPAGYERSFAELGEEVKNSLSHRARALQEMKKSLDQFK